MQMRSIFPSILHNDRDIIINVFIRKEIKIFIDASKNSICKRTDFYFMCAYWTFKHVFRIFHASLEMSSSACLDKHTHINI